MKVIYFMILISSVLLCACSKKPSTYELATQFSEEVAQLPDIVESITDEGSAQQALEELEILEKRLVEIASQTKEGEYLSSDERIEIDEKIEDAVNEAEYHLKKLRNQPELLILLEKPLTKIANTLERAGKVMKSES